MSDIVLDASALLALIYKEAGHEMVAQAMPKAIMSAINLSEVLAILYEEEIPESQVDLDIANLITKIIDFDQQQALIAAKLRKHTKQYGLSLGDRACLALAESLALPVLTADKHWSKLKLDLEIRMIR